MSLLLIIQTSCFPTCFSPRGCFSYQVSSSSLKESFGLWKRLSHWEWRFDNYLRKLLIGQLSVPVSYMCTDLPSVSVDDNPWCFLVTSELTWWIYLFPKLSDSKANISGFNSLWFCRPRRQKCKHDSNHTSLCSHTEYHWHVTFSNIRMFYTVLVHNNTFPFFTVNMQIDEKMSLDELNSLSLVMSMDEVLDKYLPMLLLIDSNEVRLYISPWVFLTSA